MITSLILQSQTQALLVDLCSIKDHLGINDDLSNKRLTDYIYTAQEYLTEETGLTYYNTTWLEQYDCFPCGAIETVRTPVVSLTSLTYYDSTNVLQTLAEGTDFWATFPTRSPAILEPDQSNPRWFPTYRYRPDAVQLIYTCSQTIPHLAAHAVKTLVVYFDSGNRGSNDLDIPPHVERIFRLLRNATYN